MIHVHCHYMTDVATTLKLAIFDGAFHSHHCCIFTFPKVFPGMKMEYINCEIILLHLDYGTIFRSGS